MSLACARWYRPLLLLCVLAFLSGCAARLAYNTMNYWVPWYLDDYVSLTPVQASRFESELLQAQAVHRRQELPKLHQHILEFQQELQRPLTSEQIRSYHYSFTALAEQSASVFTPPAANLLRYMSNIQIDQINSKINKELDELRVKRDKLSQEEKLQRYTTRFEKFSKEWIGSLTEEQQTIIEELAKYQLDIEPVFFSARRGLYQQWQALLSQRHRPEFDARLKRLLRDVVGLRYAPVQSQLDQYLQRRFALMAQLNQSLSSSQRQYLMNKLTDTRKEIAVLIQQ
ncbi:DUF6279 family lipoprotein [Photobacterium arenosum]|uniref:DUF6279 family lipoprotein n=1 Tax=Photobacterium arenosum TaxID=2774143 RepID=UPI002889A66C|nr:DUF6279 family lipoprotein [Photobacterium arenosum]